MKVFDQQPTLVFNDYKKPSLYIPIGITCTFKCLKDMSEENQKIFNCQNSELTKEKVFEVEAEKYILNFCAVEVMHEAVILAGLEPMDNFESVLEFIEVYSKLKPYNDIVIFTGYNLQEIKDKVDILFKTDIGNIILKVGRFDPDLENRNIIDPIGGVKLISGNQEFIKIS